MTKESYVAALCPKCKSQNLKYAKPAKDTDTVSCADCGHELGKYGAVVAALMSAAKREVDKITKKHFGKAVSWK